MDNFQRNHGFCPKDDSFANKTTKRFPKFQEDACIEDWSQPLRINPPFNVFPRVLQRLKQSGAKMISILPNWPRQDWFKDIVDTAGGGSHTVNGAEHHSEFMHPSSQPNSWRLRSIIFRRASALVP